jgi:hypothetical protein
MYFITTSIRDSHLSSEKKQKENFNQAQAQILCWVEFYIVYKWPAKHWATVLHANGTHYRWTPFACYLFYCIYQTFPIIYLLGVMSSIIFHILNHKVFVSCCFLLSIASVLACNLLVVMTYLPNWIGLHSPSRNNKENENVDSEVIIYWI